MAADPYANVRSLALAYREVQRQRDHFRIEADRAMSDYDALENDADIMRQALQEIADRRPNKTFDPWASNLARETLGKVSERVTGMKL